MRGTCTNGREKKYQTAEKVSCGFKGNCQGGQSSRQVVSSGRHPVHRLRLIHIPLHTHLLLMVGYWLLTSGLFNWACAMLPCCFIYSILCTPATCYSSSDYSYQPSLPWLLLNSTCTDHSFPLTLLLLVAFAAASQICYQLGLYPDFTPAYTSAPNPSACVWPSFFQLASILIATSHYV